MSGSTVQFNNRPGVHGVPPIVTRRANTRWFNAQLVLTETGATVDVSDGIVYSPPNYDRNGSNFSLGVFLQHVVDAASLTLTTAPEQSIVVRIAFEDGHANVGGDPLYGLFDGSGQNNESLTETVGYTVEATDTTSLEGVTHKVMWHELNLAPTIVRVDTAAVVASTDVVLAEVTYSAGKYELFPRHDGAIFVFPPVWPLNHTYSW